jgi:hypothetical protein
LPHSGQNFFPAFMLVPQEHRKSPERLPVGDAGEAKTEAPQQEQNFFPGFSYFIYEG